MKPSRALIYLPLQAACLVIAFSVTATAATPSGDPLAAGFQTPPASARPRVWWHWMNGNITEAGIKLDLEWMHRVGIAGFQNFDAALETPQVVKQRLPYMTPQWQHAFKYAVTLGRKFGMEEAIAGSPGWSETGGPWVPPAQAMKKYVWSETLIEGGKPFKGRITHPPATTGAYQELNTPSSHHADTSAPPSFYAEAAVVAFRRPEVEAAAVSDFPIMSASAGDPAYALLTDGDLLKTTKLPIPARVAGTSWIQYEYSSARTIRSLTLAMKQPDAGAAPLVDMIIASITVQVSSDGRQFRTIATVPDAGAPVQTVSFAAEKAKYFRVVFTRGQPPKPEMPFDSDLSATESNAATPSDNYEIAELRLDTAARVNRFQDKAAFAPVLDLYANATPDFEPVAMVPRDSVIDLTNSMQADGTLDWTAPPGQWVVLRLGYSLLGVTNHPATKEATGLEVDKLNRSFVKNYLDGYLNSYQDTVGAELLGPKGIGFVVTDSWEAGAQNWTDDMLLQFRRLRGYDPTPWLPVLAGYVVESSDSSDKFLWDFRKTIADLTASEHYGQVRQSLRERGMGHYGESHEFRRALIADGMEVKKLTTVPMSAMWVRTPGLYVQDLYYDADDRESASVAHIYGQNMAAAESLTAAQAPWAWSPATLKPVADQEFLNGINRIVIHESAHQPLVDKAPGLTLGPFGQWFNRNETWAEQARPWIDYLARSSYLLQQGTFAADFIYFYGEDSNLTAIFGRKAPDVPEGYAFDYVNADALIHELSVQDGHIVTRSGMSYRILALDPYSQHMSLPVLRAIHALVVRGATVTGPRPTETPSLADDAPEFVRLRDELFGDGTGIHHVGQGFVYAGSSPRSVFEQLKLAKDFDFKSDSETPVPFVHRRLADGHLYFLNNRSDKPIHIDASFRVAGKVPRLWRAETGQSEAVSYVISDGRTRVPLQLEPWGAVFVVFQDNTHRTVFSVPGKTEVPLTTLSGPWRVRFQEGRGAPPSVTLSKLISWPEHADAGVKYFSGTASYIHSVNATADWFGNGTQLWLDLGDVRNLAEVLMNGRSLGVLWHTPYRVNLTGLLKPGANTLTVKVTNAWVNRLIGDQQPGVTAPITFADIQPYNTKSSLLPSGLLGPVRIYALKTR